MNMANVFPPFKIDIAGAFCVPRALRDAREQYQNGQVSRQTLQAIENAEVRNLVERLESGGMQVVSDGGFRSRDFLESWDGIHSKDNQPFAAGSALEITERISLSQHPIFEEFTFLLSVIGEGTMPKQHIPSPAEVMTQILQRVERAQLEVVYPDVRLLTDDIAACYRFLLSKLYDAGCRYIQFDGVTSLIMEETIRLNNRVLRERPAGMYIAFHAPMEMLVQLHGADAYFLNYDCGACARNSLLWFIHEKSSVFGFVLSHYPHEDELDELQAKTESVLNYIPLKRFTLCLPDANSLLSPSDADEADQWETVRLGMQMAERIFS
ncbi:cobalamin biosynthesis protein [Bacteroides sp.]|uniref:cobalamin biosynthesis protein n=1 Tax=Bacteroides sp. TaxID=29523 RepID=UPI003AB2A6F4